MTTQVYSVFPACGKTWVFENQDKFGIVVKDSDSSDFSWVKRKRTEEEVKERIKDEMSYGRTLSAAELVIIRDEAIKVRNPEFPGNYIQHIKDNIGTCNYIFVSSHEEVRKALKEAGIPYTLVFPDKKCLTDWVGRCYMREQNGNQGFPIKVLINNWYNWIEQCETDDGAEDKIILGMGEFLKDYLPEHEQRSGN